MFLIVGAAFLMLLAVTLIMLWGHERLSIKKFVPYARIEECWTGEERRQHSRFKNDIEVEYNVEKKPHLKNNGRGVNISSGGMKLMVDEKLAVGTIIDLKINAPDTKKIIKVEGEVVWTKEAEGLDPSGKRFFHSGIKFVGIREPSGMHLSNYVKSLCPKEI